MDRHILFVLLLAVFFLFTLVLFTAMGEGRLDVYMAVFTIEYLVLVEVLRPRRKFMKALGLDPVALGLVIIFGLIVTRKVVEILVS